IAAIEGPPELMIKYREKLSSMLSARNRGRGMAAASDLPSFYERVGPRRGEDVLTVAYFLNRRAGIPDFARAELSHAIARCSRPKKVNAATIYGLLGRGLLNKTRRGRYAITTDGVAIVEQRAGGAANGGSGTDLRGLSSWLGSVKRERGSL